MPNWCQNYLLVEGKPEDVDAFMKKAAGHYDDYVWRNAPEYLIPKIVEDEKERSLDFNKFIPIPQDVLASGYSAAGYDWCIDNWGTKWNLDNTTEVSENGEHNGIKSVQYTFDTAWGPAKFVILAMIEQHPELGFDLDFEESGMCFRGRIAGNGGVVHENHSEEYEEEYCEECDTNLEYDDCTCKGDAS